MDYLKTAGDDLKAQQNRIQEHFVQSSWLTSAESTVKFESLPVNSAEQMGNLSQLIQKTLQEGSW